jgi:hypothetical protein
MPLECQASNRAVAIYHIPFPTHAACVPSGFFPRSQLANESLSARVGLPAQTLRARRGLRKDRGAPSRVSTAVDGCAASPPTRAVSGRGVPSINTRSVRVEEHARVAASPDDRPAGESWTRSPPRLEEPCSSSASGRSAAGAVSQALRPNRVRSLPSWESSWYRPVA